MFNQSVLLGLLLCFILNCGCEKPGPKYPQTKGYVWPQPQYLNSIPTQLKVDPTQFQFNVIGYNTCLILSQAIERYKALLVKQLGVATIKKGNENKYETLTQVSVHLSNPCEQWPSLEMDEDYFLDVNNKDSLISSKSIWGILRGLETFSQLLHREEDLSGYLVINVTFIHDFPRFPHRGILLDTSRHFVSMDNIYAILDGMVYNKLNVFHWHIVDDQSFPFVSATFPNISTLGAYHTSMVYTPEAVASILEYARLRGIRVLPEFDTPGHTRSWGVAYPTLLTECYAHDRPTGDLGPINPAEPFVYTFMNQLLAEIVQIFPDRYVHLGGDEVSFDCWKSNPDVTNFMLLNKINNYYKLEEYYIQKVVDMVENLNSKSVVWQEVFVNGVSLKNGTVVQIWTGNQATLLNKVTAKGLPALLSACWYLDHLSTGGDWQKFYSCEPLNFDGTPAQKALVKGGEACMWGEVIDNNNVISRIFPRASATSEKLWSAADIGGSNLNNRIEEHYCRMNIRGIPAQPPSGPGFCAP